MLKIPFLNQNRNDGKFLVIEITSKGINCLALYKENGDIRVIGKGSDGVREGTIRNGAIFNEVDALEALLTAYRASLEFQEASIDKSIIMLGGQEVYETLTTARITRAEDEKEITQKEYNEFINKIRKAAYEEINKEIFHRSGIENNEIVPIFQENSYILRNGTQDDAPLGKQATQLEIAENFGFTSKLTYDLVTNLVKNANLHLIGFCTTGIAIAEYFKKNKPDKTDYVLIELGADFTYIAIVFGKSVVTSKNLPLGFEHIIEALAANMGLTKSEAEMVFESYCKNSLSEAENIVVREAIQSVLSVWIEGVRTCFCDFANVKTFPHNIYLLGYATDIIDAQEGLASTPWTKGIPFKQPPEYYSLNTEGLTGIHDSVGISDRTVKLALAGALYEKVI